MASVQGQGQGQQLQPQGQAQQQHAGAKGENAPVLQQLNMTSLRTRTQDLHNTIQRIIHVFLTNPAIKWSEVLGQFAMVNVELLNLYDDMKPILKMFVVYPQNVNADNAQILPIMLSSKLLPEMETEEAAMKELILGGIANLPVPVQTEKLQRQIEAVRSACDIAEKVITEARKVYGLGTRQGPVALPTLDKLHVTRIAEQEKLLRAATNFGEGLRIPADQQQQPSILPSHLLAAFSTTGDGRTSSYLGADGGYMKTSASVLPPSGLRSGAQQQAALPQLAARVQTPTQSVGVVGVGGLSGASPSQMPYIVNSPRSGGTNFNVPSPQQSQQTQQQSQTAFLQRAKAQQQQQQLQRQQQMQAQLQQQQQQQHQQQQQQPLRRPGTPPIPQAQVGGQPQAQVAQPLLQQQKQQLQQLQQHQQQNQSRLSQQYAHQQQAAQLLQQQQAQQLQERQAIHQMQVSQQQQNLQQQLHSSLQASQNSVPQGNQVRSQMGQLGSSMPNLYGSGTQSLLSSNMMGAMTQPMQSQNTLLQQRMQQQFQQGNLNTNQLSANQPQQNVSPMLSDSWTGTQLTQNSPNLGLPMQQQQQQLPQTNYMNMFTNPAQSNFGQNRQQPPPS